jgi:NAD(P)-dependent dehydrogenase (short-subunit alcohol dehydrogenase family)
MRNYVIIGGSSGIGQALVKQLSKEHNVIATYNEHQQPDEDNIRYQYYDVTQEKPLEDLPETIHGLAYLPGTISLRPFSRIKSEDFLKDYEINLVGAVKTIQQLLPQLKKSGEGSIVLFSTVAVQTGMGYHSLVASSKGALEGLTKALAAELAPSIRVNCIAPSLTDTPLAANLLNTDEKKEASAKRHPLNTVGTPDQLAATAKFLLTNESSWITGQILHADGGMSSIRKF